MEILQGILSNLRNEWEVKFTLTFVINSSIETIFQISFQDRKGYMDICFKTNLAELCVL